MTAEQKRQNALVTAKRHIIHCLNLDLPDELDGLYVILDGVVLPWKIHDFIQYMKRKWDWHRK